MRTSTSATAGRCTYLCAGLERIDQLLREADGRFTGREVRLGGSWRAEEGAGQSLPGPDVRGGCRGGFGGAGTHVEIWGRLQWQDFDINRIPRSLR